MYSVIETIAWILTGRAGEEPGFYGRLLADPDRFVAAIMVEVGVELGGIEELSAAVDVASGLAGTGWIRTDAPAANVARLNAEVVMDMAAVAVDVREVEHEALRL